VRVEDSNRQPVISLNAMLLFVPPTGSATALTNPQI